MNRIIRLKDSPPPIPQSFRLPPPPPPPLAQTSSGNKISPGILLIIGILSVIFFVSGLLHLLIRCLLRPTNRDPEELDNSTALQGQLQQLFHLHDAGVDQSFIDTLPIFFYKAIIGLKDPFDCAVCLCEFEGDDKLRLLPKCSHAFHLECIDTWLLSHSTCPLCRRSLIGDFSPSNCCSPVVFVLESAGSESSREMISPDHREDEIGPKEEEPIVPVKLGKLRNVDVGTSDHGNSDLGQRRCMSMGYYEYVMNETSLLQVAIKPCKKKHASNKNPARQRLAMSECDCQSRRGFNGFDPSRATGQIQKKESFSISKIWLRSTKGKSVNGESSRRALSFRLPIHRQSSDEQKMNSDLGGGWEKSGSEIEVDVETGSCNNSIVGSVAEEAPSFSRRTLLWIMGRQNKVGDYM